MYLPDKTFLLFVGIGSGVGLVCGVLISRTLVIIFGTKRFQNQNRIRMTVRYKLLLLFGVVVGIVSGALAGVALHNEVIPNRMVIIPSDTKEDDQLMSNLLKKGE